MKTKLFEVTWNYHNDLIVLLPTIYSFYDRTYKHFELGIGFYKYNLFLTINTK